jgi:hypothetical protein
MAGAVGSTSPAGRRRVFVLVDKGIAQGVFLSWDAAESFADEHRLSLDHLMEYETSRDYPDHLHLMAAMWEEDWEFQGEWTREVPDWGVPPKKVRLDHYHAKADGFHILRQKEFDWKAGLLEKINPMAPDTAIKPAEPSVPAGPARQWKPKLAPLKPMYPPAKAPSEPLVPPEPGKDMPEEPSAGEPEQLEADKPAAVEPAHPAPAPQEPETSLPSGESSSSRPDVQPSAPTGQGIKPKIAFQKRQPLRLKRDAGPKPIPSFKPTAPPPVDPISGKVETPVPVKRETVPDFGFEEEKPEKPSRIWPMRVILPVLAVPLFWALGVYWWVFKPAPTAAETAARATSLASARALIIEPEMAFFQLQVDPIHQQRWIMSLNMNPIGRENVRTIPTFHALETWAKPEGFIRPPYSLVEVDEWWNLRLRKVKFGFSLDWEDGSALILDLESDTLIGWMPAGRLQEVLN